MKSDRHLLGLISLTAAVLASAARGEAVDFERQIRPILRARCVECHGAKAQKSGLRLDARAFALKGGDGGPVFAPGKSAESELIRRVSSSDPDERMPPEGDPLTGSEIQLLRRWIDAGANWAETDYDREAGRDRRREHWSYQPIKAVKPPAGGDPIEAFIRKKLAERNIKPAPPADRRTLIRRLFLDMLGLPPSPAEVQAFVKDESPQAWSRLIDKVLASPQYGERWAQHWLDVIRYADTHGFEVNTPRDNAWPYRDYVIAAFNGDKPYDQFLIEQIAGDAFEADAATGFLVASAVLLPGQIGADDESKRLARQDSLDEIIVGTGATLLGLTIGCARCHDHKFDPISQRDYYSMQAFFAGVEYGDRPMLNPEYRNNRERAANLAPMIESMERDILTHDLDRSAQHPRIQTLVTELDRLRAEKKRLETPRLAYAGVFREPDRTYVLRRGDPEQRIDEIGPAVPELFQQVSASSTTPERERRLTLARWIASAKNPLTTRVMVNRIWQYHFGRGLVTTPSDFGLNGSPPSHPELLDWLANEFVRSGWSVKHMHRLILLSATYRQSSQIDGESARVDRDNSMLWRFPPRRLEAEAIRDSMLGVTGELNPAMGGPGFNFFQVRGGLNGFPPVEQFGPNELRRMVYAHKVRMERVPVFGVFDCPDAGQAMPARSRSTTPLQALNLFNSRFVADRSEKFAERVLRLTSPDVVGQVEQAFELALGRAPSATESAESAQVVREHGLATLCRVLLNCNEFLFLP